MKLWVDDLREPPDDSWVVVRSATSALEVLNTGLIREVSLDHDLGEGGTGYQIAAILEAWAFSGKAHLVPEVLAVHSANPVGRKNIESAFRSIRTIREELQNG